MGSSAAVLVRFLMTIYFQKSIDKKDDRSEKRSSRSKPWADNSTSARIYPKTTANKGRKYLEIHYQKSLPRDLWLECKPKKYVTNHRYGNHYELRNQRQKDARRPVSAAHRSPGHRFLWENNCQLWLMEKLDSVPFSSQAKRIEQMNEDNERASKQSINNIR